MILIVIDIDISTGISIDSPITIFMNPISLIILIRMILLENIIQIPLLSLPNPSITTINTHISDLNSMITIYLS